MLTGKDIAQAIEHTKIERSSMDAYEELARLLNTAHIAPLQGLVRDYHAALVDVREGRTLMSDCAFALEKRKKVLLNEEI